MTGHFLIPRSCYHGNSSVLRVIENNDLNEICKECGISALQKVKLKAIIVNLAPQATVHSQGNLPPVLWFIFIANLALKCDVGNVQNIQVIIDKEERLALSRMAAKIKAMSESVVLITETVQS